MDKLNIFDFKIGMKNCRQFFCLFIEFIEIIKSQIFYFYYNSMYGTFI
jgi:hypothetical protein